MPLWNHGRNPFCRGPKKVLLTRMEVDKDWCNGRVVRADATNLTKASPKAVSKYSLNLDIVLLTSSNVIYIRLRILPIDLSQPGRDRRAFRK